MTRMFFLVFLPLCFSNQNYSRPTHHKPLTEAQQWALGASGILGVRNHMKFDSLAGCEINVFSVERGKRILKNDWDIESKETLLDTLKWLEEDGHSTKFEDYREMLLIVQNPKAKSTREKFQNAIKNNEEFKLSVDVVKKYQNTVGRKSLYGWDAARYICVCRWAYVSGYLTEEEAWDRIMPAARFVQRTFKSWQDLGKNYIIGREFWSPKAKERYIYEDSMKAMLEMPDSPCKKLPWKLYLGENEEYQGGSTNTGVIVRNLPTLMDGR